MPRLADRAVPAAPRAAARDRLPYVGSLTDADDAVQEAWLRLNRSRDESIDNIGAWLTTVVGRVCLDMLRARRARREDYLGAWLPQPIVSLNEHPDPEQEALLADSVGLALLVVLETLTPQASGSRSSCTTPSGCRSNRSHPWPAAPAAAANWPAGPGAGSCGATTMLEPDLAKQRAVAAAFLAAARGADFDALLRLLDPDVALRAGPRLERLLAPPLLVGAQAVCREIARQGPRSTALPTGPGQRRRLPRGTPAGRGRRRGHRHHRRRRLDHRDRPDPRPGQAPRPSAHAAHHQPGAS